MDTWLYFIFIFLFLFSAFFSGTELALMSLGQHKIESLLKEKKFGSKALKKIKENNDRLLIAILIGNNLVNVYAAALATQISLTVAAASGLEEGMAIAIATGLITFLILMFGEIIPKSFAIKNAEKISLIVAPIYKFLILILFPVIFILEKIIKLFTGKNLDAEKITAEEIESFIDMGKNHGTLDASEHKKIKGILDLEDILVEEIMTPRVDIERLSLDTTVGDALEYYIQHTHSRLPVYKESIDKIDYFLTIRDLIGVHPSKKLSNISLAEVLKVPLNQPISAVFDIFQKNRKHLAIVIDEYGGVAGLITLEDILEEVFGEIRDETDREEEEIQKKAANHYVMDADILFEDMLEKFSLELESVGMDEKEFSGETLSYIITHKLERFPHLGEELHFAVNFDDNDLENDQVLYLKIVEIESERIEKVEVYLKQVT